MAVRTCQRRHPVATASTHAVCRPPTRGTRWPRSCPGGPGRWSGQSTGPRPLPCWSPRWRARSPRNSGSNNSFRSAGPTPGALSSTVITTSRPSQRQSTTTVPGAFGVAQAIGQQVGHQLFRCGQSPSAQVWAAPTLAAAAVPDPVECRLRGENRWATRHRLACASPCVSVTPHAHPQVRHRQRVQVVHQAVELQHLIAQAGHDLRGRLYAHRPQWPPVSPRSTDKRRAQLVRDLGDPRAPGRLQAWPVRRSCG
jgi:hypothetical protein